MVLKHVVIDRLYRFEILLSQLPDGYVGFEVHRVEGGTPKLAMEGWCDEGALLDVKLYLRENTKAYLKKMVQEDLLTPFLKKEHKFYAKYNARHEPRPRRPSRQQVENVAR